MTSYTILKTAALGDLLLIAGAAGTEGLTGIFFSDREHAVPIGEGWRSDPGQATLRQAARQLEEYLDGRRREFSLSLSPAGTAFQQAIWRQIAAIPFGRTISYSELARRAGAPDAVRAAGAATGRNPLSIVVPCHRVIGKGGAITGYAGGIDRKRHLLELERRLTESERQPEFEFVGGHR